MKIEKEVIDLKTGKTKKMQADVQPFEDATHRIMSLVYEGYRSEWTEIY
jgi:hypothetical protein